MRILANQPNNIVLLLVLSDGVTPASTNVADIDVKYSINCSQFATYAGVVSSMGNGWYSLSINPGDAPDLSPLVLTASGPGTLEWRDIHEIVNMPRTSPWNSSDAGQWHLPIGRFGVIR